MNIPSTITMVAATMMTTRMIVCDLFSSLVWARSGEVEGVGMPGDDDSPREAPKGSVVPPPIELNGPSVVMEVTDDDSVDEVVGDERVDDTAAGVRDEVGGDTADDED